MKDEHSYDSCCGRVRESRRESRAFGSGGRDGKDASGRNILVERGILRRARISTTSSKRKRKDTPLQGRTRIHETRLAAVPHRRWKGRSGLLGYGEGAPTQAPVNGEERQPDLLPRWKAATSPGFPQSVAQLSTHVRIVAMGWDSLSRPSCALRDHHRDDREKTLSLPLQNRF